MCLGIPMQLVAVEGIVGQALDGERLTLVDLSLLPDAGPGDWVLGFLGTAREILPPAQALLIRKALAGLGEIMAGRDPGAAFADLETRTPRLPPHLQAALDAGRTTG